MESGSPLAWWNMPDPTLHLPKSQNFNYNRLPSKKKLLSAQTFKKSHLMNMSGDALIAFIDYVTYVSQREKEIDPTQSYD